MFCILSGIRIFDIRKCLLCYIKNVNFLYQIKFLISEIHIIDIIRNLNLWKQKMSYFLYQECEFLISKIIFFEIRNYFLTSQVRILEIRQWFLISKMYFLYQADFLLISGIRILISKNVLFFISDIKNLIFWYQKFIFWYHKFELLFFYIKNVNFWYLKIKFLIQVIHILNIKNKT